jgi:hypothetical protein
VNFAQGSSRHTKATKRGHFNIGMMERKGVKYGKMLLVRLGLVENHPKLDSFHHFSVLKPIVLGIPHY